MILIAIPTAVALLWVFYHFAARKVLLDAQRFKVFALRDRVRMMAATGQIEAGHFSFQYVERMLCFLVHNCSTVTASKILEVFITVRNIEEPVESKRFNENAPEELKAVAIEAGRHFAICLFFNSPTFCLLVVVALLIGETLGRIRSGSERWIQTRIRLFIEERVFRNGSAMVPCQIPGSGMKVA